jgi:endonuclease/exonuclease/phosphatase family metal-dependent hydrolase
LTTDRSVTVPGGIVPVPVPKVAASPFLRSGSSGTLRVATLNLWCEAEARRERHRIAGRLLAGLDVDVVLVQEVPTGPVADTLDVVAATSGLSVASISPETGGNRNAVLTRLRFEESPSIRYTVPESPWDLFAATSMLTTSSGRRLLVVSAHLAWGGLFEHRRLLQASALDAAVARLLDDPKAPAIMGGDLNTTPESATIRHLTGLEPFEGRSAQWTDAFAVAGLGSGVSSTGANRWARRTAAKQGFLDPAGIPERRIDFLLVRGYAYGRPFAPIRCFSVGPELLPSVLPDAPFPPSDHDPVVADLWDPLPGGDVAA